MNIRFYLPLVLCCALVSPAQAHPETDLALQLISELAKVNGQALACQELTIAGRAKTLMMSHAPKTLRFGNAFEEATQQGFLAQINTQVACPGAVLLSARLDVLAQQLQTSLPVTAPALAPINSKKVQ
jgi:hypothetical protein